MPNLINMRFQINDIQKTGMKPVLIVGCFVGLLYNVFFIYLFSPQSHKGLVRVLEQW
jgi:hypothetical protein